MNAHELPARRPAEDHVLTLDPRPLGSPLTIRERATIRGAVKGLWGGQRTTPKRKQILLVEGATVREMQELPALLEREYALKDCAVRIDAIRRGVLVILDPRGVRGDA